MLAFADEAIAAGDSATAREYLAEAARLDSSDAALQLGLARADDALGRARFALSEYRRFLALMPTGPVADATRRRVAELVSAGVVATDPPPPSLPPIAAAPAPRPPRASGVRAVASRPASGPSSNPVDTVPRTGGARPPRAIRPLPDSSELAADERERRPQRSPATPDSSAKAERGADSTAAPEGRRRTAQDSTTSPATRSGEPDSAARVRAAQPQPAQRSETQQRADSVVRADSSRRAEAVRRADSVRRATGGRRPDTLRRRDSIPPGRLTSR
jgi:hypothetical protein